jgi:hypothetical protein
LRRHNSIDFNTVFYKVPFFYLCDHLLYHIFRCCMDNFGGNTAAMESTGITVEQPPDGLMKLNRASNQNRYQQVLRTDPMTEQKQTYSNGDGIFRDVDDNHHANKKGGNSYDHHDDSCLMDAMDVSSSSSSRFQNEQRQSIHWSHIYQQITHVNVPYCITIFS